jgi:hypothetical protein
MMSVTLIDNIKTVVFHNGMVRIECISAGPNNEERPSGTLLIPGNQVGQILRALTQAMQDLDNKVREAQQQQAKPTVGNA